MTLDRDLSLDAEAPRGSCLIARRIITCPQIPDDAGSH